MEGGKSPEDHLAEAARQAAKAERAATWAVRGAGCGLAAWAITVIVPLVVALVVVLLVTLNR